MTLQSPEGIVARLQRGALISNSAIVLRNNLQAREAGLLGPMSWIISSTIEPPIG